MRVDASGKERGGKEARMGGDPYVHWFASALLILWDFALKERVWRQAKRIRYSLFLSYKREAFSSQNSHYYPNPRTGQRLWQAENDGRAP